MNKIFEDVRGLYVSHIGRAADMLCINIGPNVAKNCKGDDLSQFDIHVQCPWRIIDTACGRILIASADMYCEAKNDGIITENQSVFDQQVKMEFNNRKLRVLELTVLDTKDLMIRFSDGLKFETFVNQSIPEENWRFFRRDENHVHIISIGTCLIEESET